MSQCRYCEQPRALEACQTLMIVQGVMFKSKLTIQCIETRVEVIPYLEFRYFGEVGILAVKVSKIVQRVSLVIRNLTFTNSSSRIHDERFVSRKVPRLELWSEEIMVNGKILWAERDREKCKIEDKVESLGNT